MNSDNEKNESLKKAVEEGNVGTVCELMDQGANPNYLSQDGKTLIKLAMEQNYIDIIKVLIQYGAKLTSQDSLEDYIFQDACKHRTKELIAHIFEYNKNIELLGEFLFFLTWNLNHDGPPGLEILRLLLDLGLPINEFIGGKRTPELDSFTALHQAVKEDRIDFVQELLEHGADIHKKTGLGFNCISVSLWPGARDPMIKLLIEKGLNINEKFDGGKTCLHRACEVEFLTCPHSIHTLCKYGADVNSLDDYGNTPIMCLCLDADNYHEVEEAIIEELAKLKFEGQFLCPENLNDFADFSEDEYDYDGPNPAREILDNCLEELQRMKNQKFYKVITLYDIVKMSKHQKKKLIFWTKRMDFVAAFESGWDRKPFKHYAEYLNDIFKDTLEIRDILLSEEQQLLSIFKEYLPELVTKKLAYFKNEHLFV